MSDLIKLLGQAEESHAALEGIQRDGLLKSGMFEDLMKDIFKELGFEDGVKELPVPAIMKKAYMAGYKAAKAEK